jgi:hypothetical protein
MNKFVCLAIIITLTAGCGGAEFSTGSPIDPGNDAPSSGGSAGNVGTGGVGTGGSVDGGGTGGSVEDASPDNDVATDSQQGECIAGESGCDSKVPWHCDNNNKKQFNTACQFICKQGVCSGNCEPGTKQCATEDGPVLQHCDASGQWTLLQKCAVQCDDNTKECIGNWCCSTDSGSDTCQCTAILQSCPPDKTHSCSGNAAYCCVQCSVSANVNCNCLSQDKLKLYGFTSCKDYVDSLGQDPMNCPNGTSSMINHCGG